MQWVQYENNAKVMHDVESERNGFSTGGFAAKVLETFGTEIGDCFVCKTRRQNLSIDVRCDHKPNQGSTPEIRIHMKLFFGIVLLQAIFAESMREIYIQASREVFCDVLPVPFVISDFFTMHTDWQYAS